MKNTLSEKPVFKKIFRKRLLILMTLAVVLCIAACMLASGILKKYVKEKAVQQSFRMTASLNEAAKHYMDETGNMSEEQYQRFLAEVDILIHSNFEYTPLYDTIINGNSMDFAVRVFCEDAVIADSIYKPSFQLQDKRAYTCLPEAAERFVKDNAEFKKQYAKKDTAVGFRIENLYVSGRYCAPCISYIVTEYDSKTGTETQKVIKTVEYYPKSTKGMELIGREECDDILISNIPDSIELSRCEMVMNTAAYHLIKGADAYYSRWSDSVSITVPSIRYNYFKDSDAYTEEFDSEPYIDYGYLNEIAGSENRFDKDGVCFSTAMTSPIYREKKPLTFCILLGTEASLMHYFSGTVIFSAVCILLVAFLIAYTSSKISYADRKAQYEIFTARQETTRAMAHDLKTPMTSISGYAEMLQGNVKPEKQEHYLEMIMQNVEQMNTVVSDILALSKAESGSLVLNTERLSVAELFSEIADSMSGAFENAQLELRFNAPDKPTVTADKTLVTQALKNLLHNAAVYSKPETRINVYLDRSGLRISNVPKEMPTVSAEELVKPFVKGSSERGENSGSGVGLAIAKQNFERMGFGFSVKIENGEFTAEWKF